MNKKPVNVAPVAEVLVGEAVPEVVAPVKVDIAALVAEVEALKDITAPDNQKKLLNLVIALAKK